MNTEYGMYNIKIIVYVLLLYTLHIILYFFKQ